MAHRRIEPEDFIGEGTAKAPAWYLKVRLGHLSEEQLERVRQQAEALAGRYAMSERAILRNGFRGIVEATRRRLQSERVAGRPWVGVTFVIRVMPDETDPWSHIRDDRGTAVAHALQLAEDRDPGVAAVWRDVAEGFDVIHFQPD